MTMAVDRCRAEHPASHSRACRVGSQPVPPFSSSRGSRKARNLATNPRCAITTDDAHEPVVIEGTAELVQDLAAIAAFVIAINDKYHTDYSIDFFNPADNACFRVPPRWAFGLADSDFTGSPTRWMFGPGER